MQSTVGGVGSHADASLRTQVLVMGGIGTVPGLADVSYFPDGTPLEVEACAGQGCARRQEVCSLAVRNVVERQIFTVSRYGKTSNC